MKTQPLFKSFAHAFNGIMVFFLTDRNGRIHLLLAGLVIGAGYHFGVSATEWGLLLICMALVPAMEMLNHALEKLCDVVHSDPHPLIKMAKDVAAAAVLWTAIISAFIGLLIFIPKILPAS